MKQAAPYGFMTQDPFRPITMQDVRLSTGEGDLRPQDVLAGCNAELARRARMVAPSPEAVRLREALEAIEDLCDGEIKARFGGHSSKSADEVGQRWRVFSLLVVPRNIARAALSHDGGEKP